MADIFISHSSKDNGAAEAVCRVLTNEGFSLWVDYHALRGGDEYSQRIESELEQAKVVLVLWSKNAKTSRWVLDEAEHAARKAVLVQLIIEDTGKDVLPLSFGSLHAIVCEWSAPGELSASSREKLLAAVRPHVLKGDPLANAVVALQREVTRRLDGEYSVEGQLGRGRLAVVFKARHSVYGDVALKVTPLAGILLLPGFLAEFQASLEAARQLSHANILRIRDVRLLETVACAVLDYVDGDPLTRCIAKAGGRLPLGRSKDIALDIAEALAYAHQSGVVHGRLSPANLLIMADDRPLISDFGVPNVSGSPDASAAKALFLDARYMSPEQCAGEATTPQSDQYAFGAILYEMLTGTPPFVGKTAYAIMKQQCESAPRPIQELRPECPDAVAATVMRLLEKVAFDRYLTTRMLEHDIASWPVAESVKLDVPEPRLVTHAAKLALESYSRCLANQGFLTTFYQRLLAEPSLASHLKHVNFDRQIEVLERAIRHLLEAAQGREDARREVERAAASHQRFGLCEAQVLRFTRTLLELALELDPAAGDPAHANTLRDAWETATAAEVERFVRVACAGEARTSGIVASVERAAG